MQSVLLKSLKSNLLATNPVCPYCGDASILINGLVIYPHRPDLADLSFYQCSPCDAYVGCHKGGTEPLGRLADKELRAWKSKTHKVFDPLWRSGLMKRSEAYKQLAIEMNIESKSCHVGMFSVEQCKQAYEICKSAKLLKSHIHG